MFGHFRRSSTVSHSRLQASIARGLARLDLHIIAVVKVKVLSGLQPHENSTDILNYVNSKLRIRTPKLGLNFSKAKTWFWARTHEFTVSSPAWGTSDEPPVLPLPETSLVDLTAIPIALYLLAEFEEIQGKGKEGINGRRKEGRERQRGI